MIKKQYVCDICDLQYDGETDINEFGYRLRFTAMPRFKLELMTAYSASEIIICKPCLRTLREETQRVSL